MFRSQRKMWLKFFTKIKLVCFYFCVCHKKWNFIQGGIVPIVLHVVHPARYYNPFELLKDCGHQDFKLPSKSLCLGSPGGSMKGMQTWYSSSSATRSCSTGCITCCLGWTPPRVAAVVPSYSSQKKISVCFWLEVETWSLPKGWKLKGETDLEIRANLTKKCVIQILCKPHNFICATQGNFFKKKVFRTNEHFLEWNFPFFYLHALGWVIEW